MDNQINEERSREKAFKIKNRITILHYISINDFHPLKFWSIKL